MSIHLLARICQNNVCNVLYTHKCLYIHYKSERYKYSIGAAGILEQHLRPTDRAYILYTGRSKGMQRSVHDAFSVSAYTSGIPDAKDDSQQVLQPPSLQPRVI